MLDPDQPDHGTPDRRQPRRRRPGRRQPRPGGGVAVRRLAAVGLAATVGIAVAARGPAIPAEAPTCGTAPTLRATPLYDRTTAGAATPTSAVAALVATGTWPALDLLDVQVVEVERLGATPSTERLDDAAVVVGRRDGAVVLLGHTLPHPAGGWQVDVLLACSTQEAR